MFYGKVITMTSHENSSNNADNGPELTPLQAAAARMIGKLIPRRMKERMQADLEHLKQTGEHPNVRQAREAAGQPAPVRNSTAPRRPESRPYSSERYINAAFAHAMWEKIYKPEATIDRETDKMTRAQVPEASRAAFATFYIDEANDRIHDQKGPVLIAQTIRPTYKAGHSESCAHCQAEFFGGATSKIVGAKNSSDLTLSLDNATNRVEIGIKPGATGVLEAEFSALDQHLLTQHDQEDDSARVADRLMQFGAQDFFDGDVRLEQPRYAE